MDLATITVENDLLWVLIVVILILGIVYLVKRI